MLIGEKALRINFYTAALNSYVLYMSVYASVHINNLKSQP